jgi:hypothetical protein
MPLDRVRRPSPTSGTINLIPMERTGHPGESHVLTKAMVPDPIERVEILASPFMRNKSKKRHHSGSELLLETIRLSSGNPA